METNDKQTKLFELLPQAVDELPVKDQAAAYYIAKIRADLAETKKKYEEGRLYTHQIKTQQSNGKEIQN